MMETITRETINTMDGHQFEELVESLFLKMGYHVEGHKASADGGVDITAFNYEPFVGGKYIIQCKRQSSPISEPVVRDLYGVVTHQRANKGIIVTNADFTAAATKFSEGKPIELVNGKLLLELLGRYYSTEEIAKEKKLTHNQASLMTMMIQEIQAIKDEFEATIAGAVFRQGKEYRTEKGFLSFADGKCTQIENFTRVLGNLFTKTFIEFEQKSKIQGFDGGTHVKQMRKLIRESLREFLQSFQTFYYVDMPQRCRQLHSHIVEIYKALFEALFYWESLFRAVIETPEKYLAATGDINVTLDYPNRDRLMTARASMQKEVARLTDPFAAFSSLFGRLLR